MIKIERTFTVASPVKEVFAYLSAVERGPSYTAGQREAHITSTGPMCVGTTFAVAGKFPRRGARCEVIDYEVDRRLAWQTMSGARATTNWDVQPFGAGTRVTFLYTRQPSSHAWLHLPGVATAGARQRACRSGPLDTEGTPGAEQKKSEGLELSSAHSARPALEAGPKSP